MEKVLNIAIILASGTGSRAKSEIPKQFVKIQGKTILEYSISAFEKNENIDEIMVVVCPDYIKKMQDITSKYKKVKYIVKGGTIRKESSYNGIMALNYSEANVLIHDCARPFVTQKIINDCINALKIHSAVGVAIKCTDTIIEVQDNIIKNIPKRSSLSSIQTPQCFKLSLIKKAHELSKDDVDFTDDCGLILKHNLADIFVVDGDNKNFKITYSEDFLIANEIIKKCETI